MLSWPIDHREGRSTPAQLGLYVVRCAAVAIVAYVTAEFAGLEHPVWAPMSALIVSQGTATSTLKAVWGRCLGTLTGVAVTLLVNKLGGALGLPLVLQMAVAVAVCAAITIDRPHMRVCLWTCPLILGFGADGQDTTFVATSRVVEVILGGAVGALLAAGVDLLQARLGHGPTATAQPAPMDTAGKPRSAPSPGAEHAGANGD